MIPAARLLHQVAGAPPCPKPLRPCRGAHCCVCGEPCDEGVTTRDAFGSNFTDHNMLQAPDSEHVCAACAWSIAGKPPLTLRMWTIVCRTDRELAPNHPKCALQLGPHIHLTARNDMREVVSILLDPPDSPWVCTIALSGQKHVIPYAVANTGRTWRVRMEQLDVDGDSDTFALLLWHAMSLRALGFTAEEIMTGQPAVHRITADTWPLWQHHMQALRNRRCGALLDLVLTCGTKEHIDEYRDAAAAAIERRGIDHAGQRVRARHDVEREHGSRPAARVVGAGESGARDQRRGADDRGDGIGVRSPPPRRIVHEEDRQLALF